MSPEQIKDALKDSLGKAMYEAFTEGTPYSFDEGCAFTKGFQYGVRWAIAYHNQMEKKRCESSTMETGGSEEPTS